MLLAERSEEVFVHLILPGLFGAAPTARGGSLARGRIVATDAGFRITATAMPPPNLDDDLHHRSRQRRILRPLSKAGDRTHVFMGTSWVR